LFTIGRSGVLSLGRWSSQIPAGLHVSCGTRVSCSRRRTFTYGALTLCGRPSNAVRLARLLMTRRRRCHFSCRIPQLQCSNAGTLALHRFRLVPVRSPLLGESRLISFRPGTKMFQFPGLAASRLWIHRGLAGSPCAGCPIRRSPDHNLLAVPRSFSQLSTSFFASDRLGIHRAPFVA
jgi:hypothetical protein